MFGSEAIDIGIGMAFLFLFMSLIATALREIIENFVKQRSKDLERGIKELLSASDGSSLVADFYKHPIIAGLYKGAYQPQGRELPSYIPRQSFSLALLDIVAKASETGSPLSVAALRTSLQQAGSKLNPVQRVVLTAIGSVDDDLNQVRSAIEDWYDGTMDRVSGWYARRTGRILGVIGFGAAVFFNVDAITVAQHLIQDKSLRQAVVARAEGDVGPNAAAPDAVMPAPSSGTGAPKRDEVADLKDKLDAIGFPIGWKLQGGFIYPEPQTCEVVPQQELEKAVVLCKSSSGWIQAFFGWIITTLAIMLGAPFWFDVLNKFIVVRSTVKPKEKSPDEASADARPASSGPPPTRSAPQVDHTPSPN